MWHALSLTCTVPLSHRKLNTRGASLQIMVQPMKTFVTANNSFGARPTSSSDTNFERHQIAWRCFTEKTNELLLKRKVRYLCCRSVIYQQNYSSYSYICSRHPYRLQSFSFIADLPCTFSEARPLQTKKLKSSRLDLRY